MKLLKSGDRSISQTMKGCLGSVAIAATAFTLSSCGDKKKEVDAGGDKGSAGKSLVITAIPDEKVSDQDAKFKALQEYLKTELKIDTEFSITLLLLSALKMAKSIWFGLVV
jgi:ABC-type phosphate/phosphonate transport system substrate-binding protein